MKRNHTLPLWGVIPLLGVGSRYICVPKASGLLTNGILLFFFPLLGVASRYVCVPKASGLLTNSILLLFLITTSSSNAQNPATDERSQVNMMLDQFNEAAANADYQRYFDFYTDDAIFIGTDATEHWDKKSFMIWAKPHFDKKKTWKFKSMERHIYFDKRGDLAWFDELLNTQMKICRGSGVVIRQGGQWKVQQYVLSMTIPNEKTDSVIKLKSSMEDALIQKLSQK
jgi:ketosteroid isomerase-like protein